MAWSLRSCCQKLFEKHSVSAFEHHLSLEVSAGVVSIEQSTAPRRRSVAPHLLHPAHTFQAAGYTAMQFASPSLIWPCAVIARQVCANAWKSCLTIAVYTQATFVHCRPHSEPDLTLQNDDDVEVSGAGAACYLCS